MNDPLVQAICDKGPRESELLAINDWRSRKAGNAARADNWDALLIAHCALLHKGKRSCAKGRCC